MCVVDDAVEDGVGKGGFANDVVPFRQRQLAGDKDGGVVVSVLDYFHEIAPLIGIEAFRSPIVKDQEIGLTNSRKGGLANPTIVFAQSAAGHAKSVRLTRSPQP